MFQRTPKAGVYDRKFLDDFNLVREAIASIRNIRNQKGITPREELQLVIDGQLSEELLPILKKAANLSGVSTGAAGGAGAQFVVGTLKFFVPLSDKVDIAEEIAKLEADLAYQRKFLAGVRAKLSNENFVSHAPEKVIENERKKEADALSRIATFEASLAELKK